MKKTIISLLVLIACTSVNAQTMKIYKGNTIVAEYPADQADSIVFSKENGEQPKAKKLVLDKYTSDLSTDDLHTVYYPSDDKGSIVAIIDKGTLYSSLKVYAYKDNLIQEESFDHFKTLYTLNDKGLIIKAEPTNADGKKGLTKTFEYDSEGRLISSTTEEENTITTFTWNDDGDMVKSESVSDNGATTVATTIPSELSVDHEHFIDTFGSIVNSDLFMKGYYGKAPKHLPAHYEYSAKSGALTMMISEDYTYTITNGRLMEVEDKITTEVQILSHKNEKTNKMKFFWKEIE